MEVAKVLRMNAGMGETSYAMNSLLQQKVIRMTKPITEEAIRKLLYTTSSTFPAKLAIADLGCSSGPNSLLVVSDLIKTVGRICDEQAHREYPEFQVFLNDLPGNDFNTIFSSLHSFQERLNYEYSVFINGVPGSFFGRLFPADSLHFVHSSYSVHWLSRLPREIVEENKGNIYMARSSPEGVLEAYYGQFRSDFRSFLKCRAVELVAGGRMVLTFIGKRSGERLSEEYCYTWELMSTALNEMASQGMIDQEKLDSFNIPLYTPSPAEVAAEVKKQGAFAIDRLEVSEVSWDACSDELMISGTGVGHARNGVVGYNVAKFIRAVAEPLLVSHFNAGGEVIDEIFRRYAAVVSERMANEKTRYVNVTVSLTKTAVSPLAHV
ncbi:unnamed protein product [Linum tenue]|uniref:Uncharacterized protein n=1 Tax=Linum tenue TaxID=586396 RepID=A0AAV0GXZ1_9ROSI|nr:unnamed protein product [Linum tenue]